RPGANQRPAPPPPLWSSIRRARLTRPRRSQRWQATSSILSLPCSSPSVIEPRLLIAATRLCRAALPYSDQCPRPILPKKNAPRSYRRSARTTTTFAARIAERRADPTKRKTARRQPDTALLLNWLRADRRCRRYLVPGADRSRQNASSECASSKLISWQQGQAGKWRPLINLTSSCAPACADAWVTR